MPFTTTGTFNSGNTFRVQLSDATGSFSNITDLQPGGTASPLVVTIPTGGIVATGTQYKVRVVSLDPIRIGSASATTLTITNGPAAPGVTPVTYCQGAATAPLTATGTNLKWYTSATGGTGSTTAPTPSSGGVGLTSYYVSQSSGGGCESPRARLDVTVNPRPAAPAVATSSFEYCVGATAQPLSATATGSNTLKWYLPNGSTSTTAPTPATTTAGDQTFQVSQVNGLGCESPQVTITVRVNAIPAAPAATSPIELCEGSPTSPLTATGSNLKWYDASNTVLPGAPTPSNTASSSYSVTQTVNGCESSKKAITVTIKPKPAAPAVAATTVGYCYGATVPALSATGTALKWYNAAGTQLGGAPTPSNTASSSFQVSQTVNGCESDKVTITVNITRTAAPTVSSPVVYCAADAASALSATGTDLKWYGTNATGGTASATAPTPATASAGTTTYYVTQTLNGCESDQRAGIAVQVNPRPAAPGVSPVTYCQNASTSPLTASGSNLKWYGTSATGGTASGTAPAPGSEAAGITSYYVSQTNGFGCESSTRAKLDVTINPTPAAPAVAAATVEYCIGATAQVLAATATGSNTLKWYLPAGTNQPAAPTPLTTTAGEQTFRVTQTNSLGCESPETQVKVTINALPAAPTVLATQEFCQEKESKTFTLAATGTNLRWYQAATGGTAGTAPVIDLKDVETYTYYVSQVTDKGCEGPRARINVRIKPLPGLPAVVASAALCQNDPPQPLSASPVTGGTLNWYGTNATGGTRSGTAPVPPTTTGGDTTYYVSQSVAQCEGDRAAIKVTIRTTPAPTVEALKEYCRQATATPLTAQGDNLKWYNTASGGTASTAAPLPGTTTVGTTAYYVSQTRPYTVGTINLNCEGPRAKIDVTINPLPGLPGVSNIDICQTRGDEPLALQASGNNLRWYTTASDGTASNAAPTVNLRNAGTTSFFVSQVTAKGCEGSRAELRVRVKRLPNLPGVTPEIVYCQFDAPAPLAAGLESGGSVNWYGTSATGGNRSGAAPVPSTQEGGLTSFYVSQTLEGCEGDRAEIKVRVNTTPKPTVTSPVEYCQNVTAAPLAAQGEKLKWYREQTSTESQATPFTPFTANVGTYSFYVTQTGSNTCESPKEEIRVRVKPLPSATIEGDNSISLGQSAEILVNFTGDGPWSYVLSNGLSGQTSQTPLRVQVSPQRTTTYLVTEVANECGKGVPNGSAMVTVRIPTISTGNPTTASLCAGRTFTIPFQASGEFVATNKFNVQISPDTTDRNFYTVPTVQNGNEAVATVPDSTAGGNYFVRVVGQSPQFLLRGSVSPVTVTVRPLPTAMLTGTTTILIGESTTLNVALTGDGPWTFTFNNSVRDSLITTSVSPFIITVKPGATTTYSLTGVSNQCGVGKASGTARIQVDPILGTEPTLSVQWLHVYPSPVQTICVVDIEAPLVAGEAQLRVFDQSGRPLLEKKVRTAKTEVDFTRMASGVYFIQVENAGRASVRRVVKQD